MPESHASQLRGPLSAGARLIGFVSITDPERTREFYAGRLGLKFEGEDGFALVFRSGETMIRAAKVGSVTPSHGTVLGWEVDDIVDRVRALSAAGIRWNGSRACRRTNSASGTRQADRR